MRPLKVPSSVGKGQGQTNFIGPIGAYGHFADK